MLYFKKIIIPGYTEQQLEAAMRKVSLRRTSALDMESAITDIGTDKLFLGYEDKKGLTFTRLKASPEKLLPKHIIRLKKDTGEAAYEMRLALMPTVLFVMLSIGWIINAVLTIAGKVPIDGFFTITMFCGIFLSAMFLDMKLTSSRVNKAIKQYGLIFSPVK